MTVNALSLAQLAAHLPYPCLLLHLKQKIRLFTIENSITGQSPL